MENFEQKKDKTEYWEEKLGRKEKKPKRKPPEMTKAEWEEEKKENRMTSTKHKLDELRKKHGNT